MVFNMDDDYDKNLASREFIFSKKKDDSQHVIEEVREMSASSSIKDVRGHAGHDTEKGFPAAKSEAERLGRERPVAFTSAWGEIAFVTSILISLSMSDFVISGFNVLLPALIEPLDIPNSSRTWPSSVLTMVVGALLFPMGRLADMYGGYYVYTIGMSWFTIWTLITGFTQNFNMLIICRAMAGLGAAAYLPGGITMLGRTYSPGPRKNFVFSLYGALSPIGFFLGILTGGMANQFLSWKWYFWIGGVVAAVFVTGVIFTAPNDYAESKKLNIKMDWWGVCTIIPGIMLVVYSITDSSRAPGGWTSPRVFSCMIVGVLFLCAAVYVEGWVSEAPFIPFDIFRIKLMKRMLLTLFLTWGVYGMYLYYANFYIQEILKKSPLITALWFAPWSVGGFILATLSGLILHLIPGRALLLVSGVSKVAAVLLFALMPDNPNYWAWVLPAMVFEAACVNVLWTVSNVFLTTSLPKNRQGLAGALINVTLYLGCAFILAISNVVSAQFESRGWDMKEQYQGVFFFGAGIGGVALFICLFIGLGKATGAATSDTDGMSELEEDIPAAMPKRSASESTQGCQAFASDCDDMTECGTPYYEKADPMDMTGIMSETSTICGMSDDGKVKSLDCDRADFINVSVEMALEKRI